ncbi:helix-turn-helix transcriptional regulator [candidate division KSB1 bacterium]|nr:helix-turn-helix transcriptional regulator [candidate division KSB1 bacterium]
MILLSGNDELLLLTILKLRDNGYGLTIMKLISDITEKEWSIGAIYDPLYRLEKKGIVSSKLTEPTPERGGRSKRIYTVTQVGIEALKEQQKVRNALRGDVRGLAVDY